LRLDANSAEAYWARGEIYEAQGRNQQAIADLAKALSIDPNLKDAARALARLGAGVDVAESEVADAGLDGWRVFKKGLRYTASNDRYPRIKVDLEMMGAGQPRILEWELKRAPFADVGVLRFFAGSADGPRGPEEIEQIAILDLQANAVVSVETQRRGTRMARLDWDDGKLVIASADGTSNELQLRQGKAPAQPPQPPPKRFAGDQQKNPWSPWGFGGKKQKSIFDLLFGN
jgi:tetratricopeptide (TPR) repeat protein